MSGQSRSQQSVDRCLEWVIFARGTASATTAAYPLIASVLIERRRR
jgi:hypothetical protein